MEIKTFDYVGKLPHSVEAIQFNKNNYKDVVSFLNRKEDDCELVHRGTVHLHVKQREGIMRIDEYDFITKDNNGEYYPYSPRVFFRLYKIRK